MTLQSAKDIALILKSLGFKATAGTAHKFAKNNDSQVLIRLIFRDETIYLTPEEADWFRYGYVYARSKKEKK